MDVARAAAEALERQRFAALVSSQLELLRADTASWSAYTDEAEPALRDGLA